MPVLTLFFQYFVEYHANLNDFQTVHELNYELNILLLHLNQLLHYLLLYYKSGKITHLSIHFQTMATAVTVTVTVTTMTLTYLLLMQTVMVRIALQIVMIVMLCSMLLMPMVMATVLVKVIVTMLTLQSILGRPR